MNFVNGAEGQSGQNQEKTEDLTAKLNTPESRFAILLFDARSQRDSRTSNTSMICSGSVTQVKYSTMYKTSSLSTFSVK